MKQKGYTLIARRKGGHITFPGREINDCIKKYKEWNEEPNNKLKLNK